MSWGLRCVWLGVDLICWFGWFCVDFVCCVWVLLVGLGFGLGCFVGLVWVCCDVVVFCLLNGFVGLRVFVVWFGSGLFYCLCLILVCVLVLVGVCLG